MTCRRSGRRRAFSRRWWLLTLVLAAASLRVVAQDRENAPTGITLGPVVLAPSLSCSYAYDSNVFLFDPTSDPGPEPQGLTTIAPAVAIVVPFGQSSFRLTDAVRWVEYEKTTELNGRAANVASAALLLRFSTHDSLELTGDLTDGRAETQTFDPGGQVLFRGQSYRADREGIRLSREVYGHRGYRVEVMRSDLHFNEVQQPGFFDYTGYDGEAALLIPVSRIASVSLGYTGSRFDHFDVSPGADPDAISRHEAGDSVYVGLEGRLGPKKPYHLRVGWESLKFTFGPPGGTDFRGIVGDGALALTGGSGFSLVGTLTRQPYRAFVLSNNYYLYDAAGLEVKHPSPGGTAVGGRFLLSHVAYPDPVSFPSQPKPVRERETTYSLEGYANLAVRDHVSFRISLKQSVRTSNIPGGDYQDTVLSGGFIFGWL